MLMQSAAITITFVRRRHWVTQREAPGSIRDGASIELSYNQCRRRSIYYSAYTPSAPGGARHDTLLEVLYGQ